MKETLTRPLLLNLDSDEHNDEYGAKVHQEEVKSATRTPRKTPRDLMQKSDGKTKSKGLGLI